MHNITEQGVIIFAYQFLFDCNWIWFFILRKNLRNRKEFKMRNKAGFREMVFDYSNQMSQLANKIKSWQRDYENKKCLWIYMYTE